MYTIYAELALLNLIQYAYFKFLIDCLLHLHSTTEVNMHMHLSGKLPLPDKPSDLSIFYKIYIYKYFTANRQSLPMLLYSPAPS